MNVEVLSSRTHRAAPPPGFSVGREAHLREVGWKKDESLGESVLLSVDGDKLQDSC